MPIFVDSRWIRPAPAPFPAGSGGYFTPALRPYVLHPLVRRLGKAAEAELLRRALGRYLIFTAVLELRVVNEVLSWIACQDEPFASPEPVRREARDLINDEAHHARWATGLLDALSADPGDPHPPAFYTRLGALQEAHAKTAGEARLLTLLFTIVSETLVSGALLTLSHDRGLCPAVREFMAAHARDEVRHSAFFGARFRELWPRLSPEHRERFGPLLPALVEVFLAPDRDAILADLLAVGLSAGESLRVYQEAHPAPTLRADARRAARPTVSCLRRAGALKERPLREAFRAAGLLSEREV